MYSIGDILLYQGTTYLVKETSPTAIALGENYQQLVWVKKEWAKSSCQLAN